jgi:death-on-curing protein
MSTADEPEWLTYEQVAAIHSRQLRRFGGAPGLRDDGLLRSALERPLNKWQYERSPLHVLAAAYAYGLAKNHAYVDGNKRIAFMSMATFLRKNDVLFAPSPAHATSIVLALAAGEVSEGALARWIGDNLPKPDAMP